MFVGVFVQALQQAVARSGGQAVLVQERGAGFEGVGVFAVEDVGPVKAQRTVVGPFVAVQQQPFVQAQQQHVARRAIGAEHGVTQQIGPGLALHVRRQWLGAVVEGGELVVEQIIVFPAGLVGRDDGQALALQVPHGQRHAGGEAV